MKKLDPATVALVLIDLQKGILGLPLAPNSAESVLASSIKLLKRFRDAGSPVVLVNVAWAADWGDALKQPVDMDLGGHELPADFAELHDDLGTVPSDILITKRQWGAFHGTELDLQLRRRGVTTIVLAGIATNMGVESTARAAWEHGYNLLFAEDATSSMSLEMHDFPMKTSLPMIGRVRKTDDILTMMG